MCWLYCLRDLDYNVLILSTEFGGWTPCCIWIWPHEQKSRKWNIFRKRTPKISRESSYLKRSTFKFYFPCWLEQEKKKTKQFKKAQKSSKEDIKKSVKIFCCCDDEKHNLLFSICLRCEVSLLNDVVKPYSCVSFSLEAQQICSFFDMLNYKLNFEVPKIIYQKRYI